MENEFQILNSIEKNNQATQREIAKITGMSLGNVNIFIKRLVKKGLLKIEKLNPKTIRYILTPEGIREKAELTYKYVVISYKFINEVNLKIDNVLIKEILPSGKVVILFGEYDEICQLIQNKFHQNKISWKVFKELNDSDKIRSMESEDSSYNPMILVWQPQFADELKKRNIQHMDLLASI